MYYRTKASTEVTKNRIARVIVKLKRVFSRPLRVEIMFDESAPPRPVPIPAPVCCNSTDIIISIEIIICTVGRILTIVSI